MKAAFLCIFLLAVTSNFAQAQWTDLLKNELVSTLISKLGSLWQEGQFQLLGHTCYYSTSPRISKWQVKHDGKVWCPGWTSVTGKSSTKSRSGAIKKAFEDFINKAANSGVITPEQAREQIEQYNG